MLPPFLTREARGSPLPVWSKIGLAGRAWGALLLRMETGAGSSCRAGSRESSFRAAGLRGRDGVREGGK